MDSPFYFWQVLVLETNGPLPLRNSQHCFFAPLERECLLKHLLMIDSLGSHYFEYCHQIQIILHFQMLLSMSMCSCSTAYFQYSKVLGQIFEMLVNVEESVHPSTQYHRYFSSYLHFLDSIQIRHSSVGPLNYYLTPITVFQNLSWILDQYYSMMLALK